MQYLLAILTVIIIFPLAFLAAVKAKSKIAPERKLVFVVISISVLLVIFVVIPLTTELKSFFNPIGMGFMLSSLAGIILGLGGPYRFRKK